MSCLLDFWKGKDLGSSLLLLALCLKSHLSEPLAETSMIFYVMRESILKRSIKSSTHKVLVTADTWTSIQKINYMCIIAHFNLKSECVALIIYATHSDILNKC